MTFSLTGKFDSEMILSSEGTGNKAIKVDSVEGGILLKSKKILELQSGDKVELQASENQELVINESGLNVDFRVESVNDASALLLKGSTGDIGISCSNPLYDLEIGELNDKNRILNLNSSSTQFLRLETDALNYKSFIKAGDTSDKDHDLSFIVSKTGTQLKECY